MGDPAIAEPLGIVSSGGQFLLDSGELASGGVGRWPSSGRPTMQDDQADSRRARIANLHGYAETKSWTSRQLIVSFATWSPSGLSQEASKEGTRRGHPGTAGGIPLTLPPRFSFHGVR